MIQGSRESKEHVVHKSNNMHKSKDAEFILKKKKKKSSFKLFPTFASLTCILVFPYCVVA